MVTRRTLDRLALGVALVAVGAAHGPLIGYAKYANVDEAYAAALASRLLDGHQLYVGAVSQRGPLMYYVYAAFAWLHGWDNVVALRLWSLAFAFTHVVLVYVFARRLFPKGTAWLATAIMGYALSFGVPPYDGMALHGESVQLPFLVGGVLVAAEAVFRRRLLARRRVLLAGAGLLFGLAVAIKQSTALHPLGVVPWLLVRGRHGRLRQALVDTAVFLGAVALPSVGFVIEAAARGTLREMYYYTVVYNRDVHLRPTTKFFPKLTPFFMRLIEQTSFFVALTLLAGAAVTTLVRRLRAFRGHPRLVSLVRGLGVRSFVAVQLVVALVSGATMRRFFPHYFLPAIPFLALALAGLGGTWLARRAAQTLERPIQLTTFAFVLLCAGLGTVFGERVDGRVSHDRSPEECGRLIEKTTQPEDRIFVWGFSPWIYPYAHRKPAGRFVFETYVTGFVPWFWDKLSVERARIVPGSVEALLGDLDRERPEVVVDAGSVMMARPMRAYEAPGRWLERNYCFELRIAAFDLWRRRKDDAPCPSKWLPRPNDAVNWNSVPLGMPVPKVISPERTKKLPDGNFFRPIWFPDQPAPLAATLDVVGDAHFEREEREAEADGFYIPRLDVEADAGVAP